MDKRFLGVLAAIGVVLAGVFIISSSNKASAPSGSGTLTNHVVGKNTSGVVLTEYGDFQCPACGQFEPALEAVRAKYGDQISFQFRNFPLYQIHPNAIAAARSAEAADLQGKYWEMHDKLYATQSEWSNSSNAQTYFDAYAKTIGLDVTKFKTDYKSDTANDRVQADLKEGQKLGVNSTPTFFINGKKISNPDPTIDGFSKVIDAEIAKQAGSASPTPTPAAVPTPEAAQ